MALTHEQMLRFARILGWLAVATIAVLSLVPGTVRPHTGASGYIEHIIAYTITAALLSIGYRGHLSAPVIVGALSAYAGVLEICQIYIPGRFAGVIDWIVGTFGAACGCTIGWLAARFVRA